MNTDVAVQTEMDKRKLRLLAFDKSSPECVRLWALKLLRSAETPPTNENAEVVGAD
jgi:hypothetical protein